MKAAATQSKISIAQSFTVSGDGKNSTYKIPYVNISASSLDRWLAG
jgi:hypothetical protein